MLVWINDIARSAAMNMSIDEVLFVSNESFSFLRTYTWDDSYTTIGYFQKSKDVKSKKFTRRLTGGLTVNHSKDISYCFVSSSRFVNVYDQSKTYKTIHLAIQKSLTFKTEILEKSKNVPNLICVKTFYENDVVCADKKIAGSCMRRRGSKIIVQGSIHADFDNNGTRIFVKSFSKNLARLMNVDIRTSELKDEYIKKANTMMYSKYSNLQWNYRF
ncbi:MAG: hypothetical protein LBU55_03230 [Elusimicrobiota bacterium]|jgi:lipoate-protein ligase A|nr:hypothetical protein [Elusimicrobiota bacterium]